MNALYAFTRKNLKENKHRAIVTIIGVTLTSTLLFAVGFIVSIMQKQGIDNSIREVGNYHFAYLDITSDTIQKLKQNEEISDMEIENIIGEERLGSNDVVLYGRTQYDFSNISLLQGTFPQKEGELLVTSAVLQSSHKKLGEMLEFLGHTYKIVGVYEWNNHYAEHFIYTYSNEQTEKANVYMTLKNTKHAYDRIHNLSKSLGFASFYQYGTLHFEHEYIHSGLLRAYGEYENSIDFQKIVLLMCVLLGVLSLASIFVIYNAFAISVLERKKAMGVLASLGATPKQLLLSVFYEATLIAIIAIPIGFLIAWIGSFGVVTFLNHFYHSIFSSPLQAQIRLFYFGICFIFILITVYLSAFFPAMRAKETTPLDAIRMNQDIKVSRKRVKSGKWVRRLFGIEGEIAYKNKKRNRKRYRIVSISLFIAIVLFMTFSAYLDLQKKVIAKDQLENYENDMGIYVSVRGTKEEQEQYMKELLSGVSVQNQTNTYSFVAHLKNGETLPFTKDFLEHFSSEKYITIVSMEEQKLKELGFSGTKPVLMNEIFYTRYEENDEKTEVRFQILENFDTPLIVEEMRDTSKKMRVEVSDFEYSNTVKEGMQFYMPNLYVPSSLYQKWISLSEDEKFKQDAIALSTQIKTEDYKKIEANYQKLKTKFVSLDVSYQNPKYEQYQQLLELKVQNGIVLGAILLLGLIALTSILNTIYTSMQLRKKEFAMLRSIGMNQKQFYKMISLESIFFTLQSLIFGVIVSSYLIHLLHQFLNMGRTPKEMIDYPYPFKYLWITVGGVFLIVFITMLYSTYKMKKENIIDTLKEENF